MKLSDYQKVFVGACVPLRHVDGTVSGTTIFYLYFFPLYLADRPSIVVHVVHDFYTSVPSLCRHLIHLHVKTELR